MTCGDERLHFYCEHEELIRTWAELGQELSEYLHGFLMTIIDDVDQLVGECGVVQAHHLEIGENQTLGVARERWLGEEGAPRAMIALRWTRSQVSLVSPTANAPRRPFVGVRVDTGQPNGRAWRQALSERLRNEDLGAFSLTPRRPRFVVIRYIDPPSGRYWEDLEPYREAVLDVFRDACRRFAHHIDDLFEE